jgi:hypothetical protein
MDSSSAFGGPGGVAEAEAASHDCVKYQIFGTLQTPTTAAAGATEVDAAGTAEALEACRAACFAHLEPFLEGYIWQKEPFQLRVVGRGTEEVGGGGGRGGAGTRTEAAEVPAHLAGSSLFGDNIEDEWFIVWMLSELTRVFHGLTARVWDNDGEFLLIECAFHLPKWVTPDAVANRVFLRGGHLHVVPPAATAAMGAWVGCWIPGNRRFGFQELGHAVSCLVTPATPPPFHARIRPRTHTHAAAL